MKKKYIRFSIIAVVIVVGTVAVCLLSNGVSKSKKTDEVKYKTVTVKARNKIFINGTIKPIESKTIFVDPSKGKVDTVAVVDGQNIDAGTVLFTYRNEAITEKIEEANIQIEYYENDKQKTIDKLNQSRSELAEAKEKMGNIDAQASLISMDGGAVATLESEIKAYEDAIDKLNDQISQLEDTIVRAREKEYTNEVAQISGKVSIVGETAVSTSPYIIIESNTLVVKGTVSEKDYHKIAKDQQADLLALALNKTVTGKIIDIGDRPMQAEAIATVANGGNSDNSVSQYEVELSIDNPEGLLNGYHIQSTLYENDYKISIPKTAIFEKDGKSFVYKIEKKKIKEVEVTYTEDGKNVIVNSGLNENDEVVADSKKVAKEGENLE